MCASVWAGELLTDLLGENGDLFDQRGEGGHQGAGDMGVGGPLFSGGAARRGGQPGVQGPRVGAAGVAHRVQPGTETRGGQPVGAVLAVKAGQERQTDRRIQVGEQPDRPGKHPLEVLTQLVGNCHPMTDQVFAGPAGRAQRRGGGAVGDQRTQSGPVGAQRIGEHKGVEPVVFVAGRAVAAPQVFQLVGADHHHRDTRVQQGVDHRPVGAFDGHFGGSGARQHRQ